MQGTNDAYDRAVDNLADGCFAKYRRTNNCPVLVCDHHAERDGYFEIATVIDAPILSDDIIKQSDAAQLAC